MTHFSAIAASFVLGWRGEGEEGHKSNRKLGKLDICMMSKFLGHRKKYIMCKVRRLTMKCTYLFPTGNKKVSSFQHSTHFILLPNFELPFITTEMIIVKMI